MSLLKDSHPISLVHQFCEKHRSIRYLEFSVYSYKPQTVEDRRRVFRVPVDFLEKRLEKIRKKLGAEEELAFHSRVYVRSFWRTNVFHLPLIDFKGLVVEDRLDRCRNMLRDLDCPSYALFTSGRSCHLYALMLVPASDWTQFMGRLLLLNFPSEEELVDTRWVGHRLLAGYSSLRWTRNTKSYKQLPRLEHYEELRSSSLGKVLDAARAARDGVLRPTVLGSPSSKPAT